MPPKESSPCAGCGKPIVDRKYISCCDSKCKRLYHLPCVNLSQVNPDTAKSWLCPVCSCAMKKGGDNSSTPARSLQNVAGKKPNSAATAASPEVSASPTAGNSSAPLVPMSEIKQLKDEILAMKASFETAISTIKRCEKRMDVICTTMASYEARLNSAEGRVTDVADLNRTNVELQEQMATLSQTISSCEGRLKSLEEINNGNAQPTKSDESLVDRLSFHSQALLRNDIEISGVTEKQAENPHHLFLTIAALAGMKLSDSDVDFVTRTGPPRTSPNDPPRSLVVRFCRRHTRDQFYYTARTRRLTTENLKFEGPAQKIYFNDRLTRENRYLFRECRAQFKAAGYKYCWTKWGQIYVKKREGSGEEAKAIIIRSLSDIASILKNTVPLRDVAQSTTQAEELQCDKE